MFIVCLSGEHLAGKATVAAYLCETYGFKRYAFGDKLKEIAAQTYEFDVALMHDPKEKDKARSQYGGRSLRDLCTKTWESILVDDPARFVRGVIADMRAAGNSLAVVSDLQYRLEADMLREAFGEVHCFTVARDAGDPHDILNDGTLATLYARVSAVLVENHDTVVIGAGVSGIACALALRKRLKPVLVLERGKRVEERSRTTDNASGFGGSGLFSDGKYSFWPASTSLYDIPLITPYVDAVAATLPRAVSYDLAYDGDRGAWDHKPHPCVCQPLRERSAVMKRQQATLRGSVRFEQNVTYSDARGMLVSNGILIAYKNLVLAGGKFMSLCKTFDWVPKTYRRFEYGIRLEAPHRTPLFDEMKGDDPKYTSGPYRTFCCCRQGEVVLIDDLAYSGRADGPKTKHSNIGFNVRTDPIALPLPFKLPLSLFMAFDLFGDDKRLQTGLASFLDAFDVSAADRATMFVYGPCWESVGNYFTQSDRVFTCGDASGTYRGLVSAMASGRWLGSTLE